MKLRMENWKEKGKNAPNVEQACLWQNILIGEVVEDAAILNLRSNVYATACSHISITIYAIIADRDMEIKFTSLLVRIASLAVVFPFPFP